MTDTNKLLYFDVLRYLLLHYFALGTFLPKAVLII